MNQAVMTPGALRTDWKTLLAAWWPLVLGVAALFGPTFYDLLTGIWSTESYAHAH